MSLSVYWTSIWTELFDVHVLVMSTNCFVLFNLFS